MGTYWKGISEDIETLGRSKVRVRAATEEAAVAGAAIVRDAAKVNILTRFMQHTGDLERSMYSDPVATPLGPNDFTARAFPRGSRTYDTNATPYARIQELGGIIHAHNKTGLLWIQGPRPDGTWGVSAAVPEVELEGRWYLRDAVIESIPALRELAVSYWADGVAG